MRFSTAACLLLLSAALPHTVTLVPGFILEASASELQQRAHHVSLKDAVCEISKIMEFPIDCERIVVQPESDGLVEVNFEVGGQAAHMVFTAGCREIAEPYQKFQALLHPEWKSGSYKDRVIDFFARNDWANHVDSEQCNMVSYSLPGTDNSSMMRVHCVEGIDCLAFDAEPNGRYSLRGSGIEIHAKLRGENVSMIVEEMTKNFDFRTATVPDGMEPTFHAVNMPGETSRYPDIANDVVPHIMKKRLADMRKLLIAGAVDPDNVTLWPTSERAPYFTELFPFLNAKKIEEGSSFKDKLCSCPVFKTACETMTIEHVPEKEAAVIRFRHGAKVTDESEVWLPEACSSVWKPLSEIAASTKNMKEFLVMVYHSPSILKDISSDKCAMFKLHMPFESFHVHGACGSENGGRNCIHLYSTEEGTTELRISEFMMYMMHNANDGPEDDLADGLTNSSLIEGHTFVSIDIHDAKVKFNVRTAAILESEENLKVAVHIDDHTRVDDSVEEMLSWVGRVEIVDYIRGLMWHLRDGNPDERISLWPWSSAEFLQNEVELGLVF